MLNFACKIKMFTFIIIGVTVFSVAPTTLSLAEDSLFPGFSTRVSLVVTAKENIKDLIESYMGRELRTFRDVVVTNNAPEWKICVVAVELRSRAGYKTGIAFSVVISEPFNNELVVDMWQQEFRDLGSLLTTGLSVYEGHWLTLGSTEDVEGLCEGIIADFDSEYLNPARERYQKHMEDLKTKKANP